MPRCWTCRRRRLKCDESLPHCSKCLGSGVDCLGYSSVKPLTWVEGIAVRGPMKNRSFGQLLTGPQLHSQSPISAVPNHPASTRLMSTTWDKPLAVGDPTTWTWDEARTWNETAAAWVEPITWDDSMATDESQYQVTPSSLDIPLSLTEPIFQDLDYTSRFLVDYFSQRVTPVLVLRDGHHNQYRSLISLIGTSPAVTCALVTVASCHFIHGLIGSPLTTFPLRQVESSSVNCLGPTSSPTSSGFCPAVPPLSSRSALTSYYLHSKAKALRLLSRALADVSTSNSIATVFTAILLTILELFESGAGSWSVHLEGVKRLVEAGDFLRPDDPGSVLNVVTRYQAFGSCFTRPGLLTRPLSRQMTSPIDAPTPAVTNIGCPTEIVSAVDYFASLRRLDAKRSALDGVDAQALEQTLQRLHAFDVTSWAAHVASTGRYAVTLASLQHLGAIWKLAAEMYACRIHQSIVGAPDESTSTSTLASTSASVDLLIAESALLDRHDAALVKCLIWPTFIAGLASGRLAQRRWALDTLDRIWQLTLSANARNAALVLSSLWEKQDRRSMYELGSEVYTVADWDWLNELALLEDSWLFI